MTLTAKTGNGSTIVFATSGFTGAYVEIGGLAQSLPVLNSSDLSTSGDEEYQPGDLRSSEPLTCQIYWNPDSPPPLNRVVETVTITFPGGATLAVTAFIAGRTSPSLANNQLFQGEFTLQFNGGTGPTYTAAP